MSGKMERKVYAVIDEEGVIIAVYGSQVKARKRVRLHNRDRGPRGKEWFAQSMPVNG